MKGSSVRIQSEPSLKESIRLTEALCLLGNKILTQNTLGIATMDLPIRLPP